MITFILILIDQIVKYHISTHYLVGASTVIIPKIFNITYAENTGAAFSLLTDNTMLIIIISFILLYVLYKYVFVGDKYNGVKMLILGGILSNLIDRIFRGHVIDYLDFNIFGYSFPIFNIADICIVIGCVLFIFKTIDEK